MIGTLSKEISIVLGSKTVNVLIRHSKQAKNIAIRVTKHGKAELVVPMRSDLAKAKSFLMSKLDWIEAKLVEVDVVLPRDQIPIFAKLHEIEHVESEEYSVIREDGRLIVRCAHQIKNDLIRRYLKTIFLEEIEKIVLEISSKNQFHYKSIRINDTKTRWGSCSSDKRLAFNWRLIFAPYDIVHYLAVHELCHLKHMNHSVKFWNLVETICPDYKASRVWLRKNSVKLHRYL